VKDGDQVERDGKKYRVGWFQLFEKPHPSRQKYDLVARKARKESHT